MRTTAYLAPLGPFQRRTAAACRAATAVIGGALVAGVLLVALAAAMLPAGVARAVVAGGPETDLPAGLFFDAGREVALYQAPSLASDVAIEINGQVARVTVRQSFHNPSDVWLEGIYIFPLPERSAVDRLVMVIGERRVEGEILEKEEAERVYRQAAQAGQRASLLTSARPNVFMTKVANVGPGEKIVIEIEYQDQAVFDEGLFSYRFPMVVAPRYTPAAQVPLVKAPAPAAPAVPRAQPISHQITAAAPVVPRDRDLFGPVRHPDEGPANPVRLQVVLDAGQSLARLDSLYHPVAIVGGDGQPWQVTLADGSVPAERDFVLQWQTQGSASSEAAVFAEDLAGDSYVLVSLLPPAAAGEAAAQALPRDLVLVVDTSGSMHGPSIAQAREALGFALTRLGPDDRFNVIQFNSRTRSLFRAVQPASAANLRRARAYVAQLEAGGGTKMRPALQAALSEPARESRLRQVVFLTDGAVSNEHQLFLTIAKQLGETRLFTVGIGSAPNSYFMRKAAELGRGSHSHIGDVGEVRARMTGLFTKLEHPALTGITVTWPTAEGLKVERYPTTLPDLYSDQPVTFTARLPGLATTQLSGALVVEGWIGEQPWRRELALDQLRPAAGVAALWGRARFAQIQDGLYQGRDPAEVRAEALAVALHHRLVTAYTSLVAVDDQVVRPEDAALKRGEIARNLPHGWDYDYIFGPKTLPMELRELPPDLLRETGFGTQQALALPQTGTPATLQALLGLVLLLVAGLLLVVIGKSRFGRSGAGA